MHKEFAIFDLDGTLADSMPFWKELSAEYLKSKGVDPVPEDILERIKPMTIIESAGLFVSEFGIEGPAAKVASDLDAVMAGHYKNDVPVKPGVPEYLEGLRAKGVRMCVASATSEELIDACLRNMGIRHYFEFVISCNTVGVGKKSPLVYQEAARRLGARPEDCTVYEDASYAARTARNAGFHVCAVYDVLSDEGWDELAGICHEQIKDWRKAEV